ncbi:membrane protein [Actinotalea ferrariae CF5-4]|uniref:Membrane protein n=1 Tax=Actinotalea ferrariae CF5-4 TaxID=948458 RepID=A0A021VLU2_9CELL|nr:PH domain-containing protein [Actinotalea ferrariae]EYR62053.1 membrane protein [Actinotalea ferrariae CF5-4]
MNDGPFDPQGVVWQAVSPRLTTVRLISTAIALAVPLAVTLVIAALVEATWVWVLPAAVLALGVWAAVLVPRQVRALGYAERDEDLLIRRGILFRALVVVPYGRMQLVDVQAGPLDRWGGIAKLQLHTASASTNAVIPGLTPQEAARLRDRLAARGEARLAGL